MNVGELVFNLGFKSTGKAEATAFSGSIDAMADASGRLNIVFEQMLEVLESIAVKMHALTNVDINANKAMRQEENVKKILAERNKNLNNQLKDKRSLLGMVNDKMSDYFGKMNAARLQIIGISSALTWFTKKMADSAVMLDRFQSLTGVAPDTMQRISSMAAETGAKTEDLASAIQHFQQMSVNIKLGRGGDLGPWQLLGLSPHTDPVALLDQLGAKLRSLPPALGTTLARDLGLSDDLIYFLKNAPRLKPVSTEVLLTDKEIKRLKDFDFYFNRIWNQSKLTFQKLAALFTPFVNQMVYGWERVTLMISEVANRIDPFMSKIEKFMPFLAAMGALLFAQFFPITAAIILFASALEDLWSFVKGEDSLFGRMLKYVTDLKGALSDVVSLFGFLSWMFGNEDAPEKTAKALKGLSDAQENINKNGVGKWTSQGLSELWEDLKKGLGSTDIKKEMNKPIGKPVDNKGLMDMFSAIWKSSYFGGEAGKKEFTINNTFNVSANNPTEAARKIHEKFNEQLKQSEQKATDNAYRYGNSGH